MTPSSRLDGTQPFSGPEPESLADLLAWLEALNADPYFRLNNAALAKRAPPVEALARIGAKASAQELRETRFFEIMDAKSHWAQLPANDLALEMVKTGAVWGAPSPQRDKIIFGLFLNRPEATAPWVASRPEFHRLSVEADATGSLAHLGNTPSLDSALALCDAHGRLETLSNLGLGPLWLRRCVAHHYLAGARRAVAAGVRLDGARDAAGGRADLLARVEPSSPAPSATADGEAAPAGKTAPDAGSASPRPLAFEPLSADALADSANQLFIRTIASTAMLARSSRGDGFSTKKAAWEIAVAAGAPLVDFPSNAQTMALIGHLNRLHGQSDGLGAMCAELSRGGLASGAAKSFWLRVSLLSSFSSKNASRVGAEPGQSPVSWALAHGLDAQFTDRDVALALSSDRFRDIRPGLSDIYNPAPYLNSALKSLLDAGVRLAAADPSGPGAAPSADRDADCAFSAAIAMRAPFSAFSLLAKLGAAIDRPDADGRVPLQRLMEKRGKQAVARARGFLDALREADARLPERAAQAKGKGGSGPLHWAAKTLGVEMMELALELGAGINDLDTQGATAGHWAAARHSEKIKEQSAAAVSWLAARGLDWSIANKAGDAAAGAFARKAGFLALPLFELDPKAAQQKNAKGESALDALARRDEAAHAQAERLLIGLEARGAGQPRSGGAASDEPPASPPAPRKASRRI